jgi:hypothetical protein
MKVSDILRLKGGTLFTARPDEPLAEAVGMMAERDMGSLVVMSHGDLVGMLTFREVIQAIVKNGGLFTQCTGSPLEGGWCKKCAKDVEKNGTPTNGDVEARLAVDIMAYKIGNTEVKPYIEYMIKHNISPEQAEQSAASYGLTIDPRQFEKKKRGRKQAAERTMAPGVETPDPRELAEITETVVSSDLPGLHRARAEAAVAAAGAADPEEVADDKELTIREINSMKKEDVHRACEARSISIDGKDILTLKKALKALVA